MSAHQGWEEQLFALFDDLEGQASARFEIEREAELRDRSRSEYRQVTLDSRLMASVGDALALDVRGVGRLEGELRRVGEGWCLVRGHAQDWIVRVAAIEAVHGASSRSVPEVAWSPLNRIGVASALRRLADSQVRCVVHLVDGARHEAVVSRVGADFVELEAAGPSSLLVALAAVSAVQSRD